MVKLHEGSQQDQHICKSELGLRLRELVEGLEWGCWGLPYPGKGETGEKLCL